MLAVSNPFPNPLDACENPPVASIILFAPAAAIPQGPNFIRALFTESLTPAAAASFELTGSGLGTMSDAELAMPNPAYIAG